MAPQLEKAGIIEHVDDNYLLTPAGEDLRSVVFSLGEWGAKWHFDDPRHSELDPEDGRLELHGTPAIVRRLPATLELSPIADIVTAAAAAAKPS